MGVRKNQNKLTAAEKQRFVAALKKMKADLAASYGYDKYPRIHEDAFAGDMNANPAHMGPAFFPWHRQMLRMFERDLEAADVALGNDGAVALPYWDWTHDNVTDPSKQRGSLWKDDLMGGFGNPVRGMPFGDGRWPLLPGSTPSELTRVVSMPSLPTKAQVDEALNLEGFDCHPWNVDSPTGPALASPPAPLLTGRTGGALAPGIYRVAVTYRNANGETRASQEAVICLGGGCSPANSNNAIEVRSPANPGGATGYQVYVSVPGGAAGSATLQGGLRAMGSPSTISSLAAGAAQPGLNSTGSFRNFLEGWTGTTEPLMHNRVHVWVGGSMAPGTSPNDPVFFLHHCNIDRLWALWQFRHPGQHYPLVVPRNVGVGNRPHGLMDEMPPWDTGPLRARPIDVLNHQAMGYSYDTDPVGASINTAP
jgi:hypothetical protein